MTGSVAFATSTVRLGGLAYSVCAVLTLLRLGQALPRLPAWLVRLGQYSFGVYLIHMIFLSGTLLLAAKMPLLTSCRPVHLMFAVAVTTAASYATVALTRRVLPPGIAKSVLGFGA